MAGVGSGLFAAAPPKAPPPLDMRPVWAGLAWVFALLAVATFAFAFAAWWWRRRSGRPGPNEQLAHFRQLYEREELSPEEYDRVRALLQRRLLEEMQTPPAPTAGTPSQPPPDPGGETPRPPAP